MKQPHFDRIHRRGQNVTTLPMQTLRTCNYGQAQVNLAPKELFQSEELQRKTFWEQVLLGDMEEQEEDM